MAAGDEQAGGLILIISAFAFFYWVTGPENDKVVEYEASCQADSGFVVPILAEADLAFNASALERARQDCRVTAVRATEYHVNAAQARVISNWLPELGLMNRYENCTIFDRETWSCPFADGSGGIGMVNGLMAKSAFQWKDESLRRYFAQRRWQYWLTSALNLVAIYPTADFLKPEQRPVPF